MSETADVIEREMRMVWADAYGYRSEIGPGPDPRGIAAVEAAREASVMHRAAAAGAKLTSQVEEFEQERERDRAYIATLMQCWQLAIDENTALHRRLDDLARERTAAQPSEAERRFPVQNGPDIPWSVIAPFEKQARKQHGGQTLEQLAARQGLSVCEVLSVLEGGGNYDAYWCTAGRNVKDITANILRLQALVAERSASPWGWACSSCGCDVLYCKCPAQNAKDAIPPGPEGATAKPLGDPTALNEAQQAAVKEWAADDRLWTTQETVEFNLRTFARVVLKSTPQVQRQIAALEADASPVKEAR
jgi:hypothetical protein